MYDIICCNGSVCDCKLAKPPFIVRIMKSLMVSENDGMLSSFNSGDIWWQKTVIKIC